METLIHSLMHEGCLLYPYRKSYLKNQRPWNFGVLYPPFFAQGSEGADMAQMQAEFLVEELEEAFAKGELLFLQLDSGTPRERRVKFDLKSNSPQSLPFHFGPVQAKIETNAVLQAPGLWKLTVRVSNESKSQELDREAALKYSLLSTHIYLKLEKGAFVSLMDPGEKLEPYKKRCINRGCWPVLLGTEGERTQMLASPIILYDYPRVAPKSPGDFFDNLEMDEMLSLRVLTLSEEEKKELRSTPGYSQQVMERMERLSPDELLKLHGETRLQGKTIGLGVGSPVRLNPKGREDIFDMLLIGKQATIVSVEEDFEGRGFFTVTIDEDPGKDLGKEGKPGHRFFFRPEEVEPL